MLPLKFRQGKYWMLTTLASGAIFSQLGATSAGKNNIHTISDVYQRGARPVLSEYQEVVQAASSWSVDACCAKPGNGNDCTICIDHTSSSDWLFGLWPGPPQRFEPNGFARDKPDYQFVSAGQWPEWGLNADLRIGDSGAPGRAMAKRSG